MVAQSVWQHTFNFFSKKPIVVEPVEVQLTSDAGLLPIREFDRSIRLTEQFANALEDRRHPSWAQHGFSEMVRSRVFGIIADYEDQNDHDVLRSDPRVFRTGDDAALGNRHAAGSEQIFC